MRTFRLPAANLPGIPAERSDMAANVSSPYAGAPPARHPGARVAVGLLGLAALVVGVVLLFHPVSAAHALALLVGLGFVVAGLLEVVAGWGSGHRTAALVVGALLVVGGVLAAVWPHVTLWTLALIVGLSLIVHGIVRIALATTARAEVPGWGWLAFAGVVNVLVGVLAIAWPQATVLVLSLVLGIQVALFGVLLLVAAFLHPTTDSGS
jgi:uncharacterized membrane protein HdeD (DUF308 family)